MIFPAILPLTIRRLRLPSFGKRLKAAMMAAGIFDNAELAGKMNVPVQTIRRWLRMTDPDLSAKSLLRLAVILNVRAHWLGTGEGPLHRFHASTYTKEELTAAFDGLGERERVLLRDVMGTILRYRKD